jgi:ABC-type amino acid transport substrate-binding protein
VRTSLRLALVLAVATAALVAACSAGGGGGSEGRLGQIKSKKEIMVAGAVSVPLIISSPSGEFSGLEHEMLQKFATELGVKLTMVPTSFDVVVSGLQTDKWDLVPALCRTPARQEVIDFTTQTTVDYKNQFYFKKDNPDLQGAAKFADINRPEVSVATNPGAAGYELLKKVAPNAEAKPFPGQGDAEILQQVLSDRADGAFVDWPIVSSAIERAYPGQFTFIPADMTNEETTCPVAWGTKKGETALQKAADDFLKKLASSGELKTLQDKWFTPENVVLTP